MRVCVIGLGKIGLPLAVAISKKHDVIGLDSADAVVNCVNSGVPHFPNEESLSESLKTATDTGRLVASTAPDYAIGQAEVVVICVPLVIGRDAGNRADFTNLDAVSKVIGEHIRPGSLVVLETTVPVGTTRRRLRDRVKAAHRDTEDFDVKFAFSPERVSSGRVFRDLSRYPKIVGGVDPEATQAAKYFYESFLEFDCRDDLEKPNGVWSVSSSEVAEMIKLCETTYRDVNIALANEFASDCAKFGVPYSEVMDGANSQPFSHLHKPGMSVGGHCIPVYPHLLLESGSSSRLVPVAREINSTLPKRAVVMVEENLGTLVGKNVLIAGLSYRPLVKEAAFSGAFAMVDEVLARGGKPYILDPLFSAQEIENYGLTPFKVGGHIDGVIVHTYHPDFKLWTKRDFPACEIIVDNFPSQLAEDLPSELPVVPLFE